MEDPSREPDRSRALFCPGCRVRCAPVDLCACCRNQWGLGLPSGRFVHWELTAEAA